MRLTALGLLLLTACGTRPPQDTSTDAWLAVRNRPVIVVEGTQVTFHRQHGAPTTARVDTPGDRALLDLAWVPIRLHQRLTTHVVDGLRPAEASALHARRRAILQRRSRLPRLKLEAGRQARQEALLDRCARVLEGVLREGRRRSTDLVAFARSVRPLVEQNAYDVARARLERLHDEVRGWWQALPPMERATVRVIVVDAPAARDGHWAVQYFMRVLDQPGEGARIRYVERGVDALAALDAFVLAEETSLAMFEDPERLQRDLLADGAQAWLDDAGYSF